MQALATALAVAFLARTGLSYYIPGTYPREFKTGDSVHVEVNSLTSFETELPYDYYSLKFCRPEGGVKRSTSSANPGTILSGLRMYNSPYEFKVNVVERTKQACPSGSAGAMTAKEAKKTIDMIKNDYRVRMVLDNMPVTIYDLQKEPTLLQPGFRLGAMSGDGEKAFIFNHLSFEVLIHQTHGEFSQAQKSAMAASLSVDTGGRRLLAWPRGTPGAIVDSFRRHARALEADDGDVDEASKKDETGGDARDAGAVKGAVGAGKGDEMWMIVGFEVMPCSIKREFGDHVEHVECDVWDDEKKEGTQHQFQEVYEGADIIYTYDVYWQLSDVQWASRWDAYLRMPDDGRVHWFSIYNSVLVVLVMSVIVAVILMRTVRRDLAKYEELLVEGGDSKEESGWKLVSGDVFRAPSNAEGFAVQVGSGVQIACTSLVTLVLAAAGFLSPASRGALLTSAIVLYLLLAITAGYAAVSVWSNVTRTTESWTGICLKTACYFPGITMLVLTLVNVMLASTGTSGAIPATMYFSLVAIWFVVSIPLTYVGGFFAAKAPQLVWPTRTNQIPRHIPPAPTAADPYVLFIAAGMLPFCTVFIELYFAMSSLWQGYYYYLFGFLFIVVALTVLITIEVSILCTYVQLCAEDYLWWWRSFRRGGSIALYVMIYALIFLFNNLPNMHGLSIMLYLAYMVVVILAIHLCMGVVGFVSSAVFVYSIFAAVKAD